MRRVPKLAAGLFSVSLYFCILSWSAAGQDPSGLIADHVVSSAPAGDVKAALIEFIEFSEGHGLGLALGKEKGDHLEMAVAQGLPAKGPATVLEMGCHAGDGTLNAIFSVLSRPGSRVISTESNRAWLQAAEKVVKHATARRDVAWVPLHFKETGDFEGFLDKLQASHDVTQFDAVILDHEEETLFLQHLQTIVEKGMLRQGGVVYVDNIKRKAKQLRDYMGFVHTESKHGFHTETKVIMRPYRDAVAVSTYLGPAASSEL